MTAAVALLCYAALVTLLATVGLTGRGWLRRSPVLGILLWQSISFSAVLSVLLSAVSLAAPGAAFQFGLGRLLQACQAAFGVPYPPREGLAGGLVGGLALSVLLGRLCWVGSRTLLAESRRRRRHLQALALLGEHDQARRVTVLTHDTPAAYCLPGRCPRIVLTSAARDLLPVDQLDAVLAHEFAHVRERHHWILSSANILAAAFPGPGLFRAARRELAELVEMRADDYAAARHGRAALAAALVLVAGGQAPRAALGAAGSTVALRVTRLLRPAEPVSHLSAGLGWVGAGLLPLLPVVLLLAPGTLTALSAQMAHICPLPWS